ncbi:ATP-binding cassette domain-containing protein [Modestobacter sp. I12A-02628]|uniref:ABC transporter ATP-binding protein n=1 Tax=Goekera deserti TaxID=2497753 RepID=A0A7K3WIZ8_9ACTN|nr:ABC transporter ATP-binding protein [Goekera deserti]MPQ99325.1 ATP-binding cassette domain-containing protein [Goekera deserti]NDI50324.1 ATP-binding cassette domain-containing protein [Goekera deserti]NEL56424.1 ABC transporter ATP-binding protein [Goekera deserti]
MSDTTPSPVHERGRLGALRLLLPFARPYRGLVALTFLGALLASLAQLAVPLVTRAVVDGPIARGDRAGLVPLLGLAFAFGVAEAALFFLRRWAMTKGSLQMERDLRDVLYQRLQRLPVSFHDHWASGQLLSRATTDVSTIRRFIGFGAVFLVVNLVTCSVVAVLLLLTYWPLGVAVLVTTLPLTVFGLRWEKDYNTESRLVQDEQGELTTDVEEAVQGIRVVKSLGRSELVFARYDRKALRLQALQLSKVRTLTKIWCLFEFHPQVTLAVILVGGSLAVGSGALTVGGLVGFVALFTVLLWPILSLGFLLAQAQEAASACDRIGELLAAPMTVTDAPGVEPRPVGTPARLRFEGVGFRFPGSADPVLRHVDLDVRPGETVALVGATGSGKTTLTSLVGRLYDVTSGRVTLDGHDVRDLPLAQLRTVVATAFEDATLFSMSVRENLTLGRPDAGEESVAEALRVAQAGFVHDLPWGLDTRIGEQGLSLSGGQRQRLALARAVLGRPSVLVLDDPLSALDVHTEALVERALREVLAETTALVVAHRASTVLLADRVALLQDGRITAVGRHSDLLAEVPAYRQLLSSDAELGPGGQQPVLSELGSR